MEGKDMKHEIVGSILLQTPFSFSPESTRFYTRKVKRREKKLQMKNALDLGGVFFFLKIGVLSHLANTHKTAAGKKDIS